MTTPVRRLLLAFTLAFALPLAACDDPHGLGLACVLERPATATVSAIETPSLDCESRICMQVAQQASALCTVECSDEGAACLSESSSPCSSGFTCARPFVVGAFADRLLCVCDDVAAGQTSGQLATERGR